jgi:integrase/recombinase XerD
MLERYFVRLETLDGIRGSWLGASIERYVAALEEQGYSTRSIYRRIPLLMRFAAFCEGRGVSSLDQLTPLVDAFAADWLAGRDASRSGDSKRRDRNWVRGIINHFLSTAVLSVAYKKLRSAALTDPFEAQAPGFFLYLTEERGLQSSTVCIYRHHLSGFQRYLNDLSCDDLGALSLPIITGFVTSMAGRLGDRSMVGLASCVRVFLRYLRQEGILGRDLSKLVETPQHYRMADIPRSISWDAVQKMLDQVERRTIVGRRDYAMLLLMVTYGLRSREVATLTLDDIDWKRDRLHIRERKANHTTAYPLAPAIGEAILDYVKNGRPHVQSREIFFRHLAPQTPLTHAAVSCCASKYLHKAGIPVQRAGSHTLRHACVQRLVDTGFPMKTIGDFVGHRSASSTAVYAKVAVDALREVALGDGEKLQ